MAWLKLVKPAFFLGNFVRGFFDGLVDETVETFTNAEVCTKCTTLIKESLPTNIIVPKS